MKRWTQVCSLVLFAVVLGGVLMPLDAQTTPFDAPTDSLGTYFRTKVAPLLVMLIMVAGFLALLMMHANPTACIMGFAIMMIVVFGISSAVNGTTLSWLGLTLIP